jgi:hypothetical protein
LSGEAIRIRYSHDVMLPQLTLMKFINPNVLIAARQDAEFECSGCQSHLSGLD